MYKNIYIVFFLIIFIFSGCTKDGESGRPDSLTIAHVGGSVISADDFSAAYEVTKLGYPHNDVLSNKISLKEDVLTQLIEEQLILNESGKIGVVYTQEEFKEDVAQVKKEYPDKVFEELLSKNAIEYSTWERRFKREMSIKKGLEKIIHKDIHVTEDELKKGILDYCKANSLKPEDIRNNQEIGLIILQNIKRNKSEKNYDELLESLKKAYLIKIHEKNWNEVLTSDKY